MFSSQWINDNKRVELYCLFKMSIIFKLNYTYLWCPDWHLMSILSNNVLETVWAGANNVDHLQNILSYTQVKRERNWNVHSYIWSPAVVLLCSLCLHVNFYSYLKKTCPINQPTKTNIFWNLVLYKVCLHFYDPFLHRRDSVKMFCSQTKCVVSIKLCDILFLLLFNQLSLHCVRDSANYRLIVLLAFYVW